jgi:hypothetical protein
MDSGRESLTVSANKETRKKGRETYERRSRPPRVASRPPHRAGRGDRWPPSSISAVCDVRVNNQQRPTGKEVARANEVPAKSNEGRTVRPDPTALIAPSPYPHVQLSQRTESGEEQHNV